MRKIDKLNLVIKFALIILITIFIFLLSNVYADQINVADVNSYTVPNLGNQKITIDGSHNDWGFSKDVLFMDGETWEVFVKGATWNDNDDLSAELMIAYDESNLYFALSITDDQYLPANRGPYPWSNEGIQISIDVSGGKIPPGMPNNTTRLYSYSIMDGWHREKWNPKKYDYEPVNINTKVMRKNDKTIQYEWRMDGLILLNPEIKFKPGMEIAFAIVVNDSDSDAIGQGGWIGWGADAITYGKEPDKMKTLILSKSQPPVVHITSVFNKWSRGAVNVEAQADDEDGKIEQVEFEYSLDAGKTWQDLSIDSSSPYSVNWDTALAIKDVNDNVGVKATAKDNDSLISSDIIYFGVDNQPPALKEWTKSPQNLMEDSKGFIRVQINVDDGLGSGVGKVELAYRIGNRTFADFSDTTQGKGNLWYFDIPEPTDTWRKYRGETLYFKAQATDAVGNQSPETPDQEELIDIINTPPIADSQTKVVYGNTPTPITLSGNDPDGDAITYKVTIEPKKGSLSGISPNLTYTPNQDFIGDDSFSFIVNDSYLDSQPGTVNIKVKPARIEISPTSPNLHLGDSQQFKVIAYNLNNVEIKINNDYVIWSVEGGIGTIDNNGLFTASAIGSGKVKAILKLDNDISAQSPVTVEVKNNKPVANPQSLDTDEDKSKDIVLTGSDADGDKLTYRITIQPKNGILSGEAPKLVYTPNLNFNGNDSFTFVVNDGIIDSDSAKVSILVKPVNDKPVAVSPSPSPVETKEDIDVNIKLAGSDEDNDKLTYKVISQPKNGALSSEAPNLVYKPNANFNGDDSFTFVVNDGVVDSDAANVSIKVNPVNDKPIANPQSVLTDEDASIAITLAGSDVDGDTLTYRVIRQPKNGLLSGIAPDLVYKPNPDFNGTDSFTYVVNDGILDSEAAIISITIKAMPDEPIAKGNTVPTDEDVSIALILSGDDPDGDPITFVIASQPSHGKLDGLAPSITYKPNMDFYGDDSFTFIVSDGILISEPATFRIKVNPVPDPPKANPQSITIEENTTASITLTGSDPDPYDVLKFKITQEPLNGDIVGLVPNLIYKPDTGFRGNDKLAFTVNDGVYESKPAEITIIVEPSDNKPPNISVLTPKPGEIFPSGTTSVILSVKIDNYAGPWHWKLNQPFTNTGTAGGERVEAVNTASIKGLQDGNTYTIYVALADKNGNMLSPEVTTSVKFSIDKQQIPDFVISSQPNELKPDRNGLATCIINLEGKFGFSDNISLVCYDLPPNVSAEFKPKKVTITPNSPYASSQLDLQITGTISPGEYKFGIIAYSERSGKSKTYELKLKIDPAKAQTFLTLNLKKEVPFMATIEVSGQLISSTKNIELGGLIIYLSFVSPASVIISAETKTEADGTYRLNFKADQVGGWKAQAEFQGNSSLEASKSSEMSFNVKKGESSLVLNLPNAVSLGSSFEISGNLTPSLENELITINILAPDGSRKPTTACKTEKDGVFRYGKQVLDQPGLWEIKATWSGNAQYESTSKTQTISVSNELGKAILVLGTLDFKATIERVYRVFKNRGFDDERDIYFLSPDPNDEYSDNITSLKALDFAITNWSKSRVNPQIPLYIYLLSHGVEDQFELDKNTDIDPSYLGSLLDKLPDGVQINIIIESCYSGNFINPSVTGPNRIILTSAGSSEKAYIRASSSFSKYFFDRIGANDTITKAFNESVAIMANHSLHKYQTPQMDANGDGISNTEEDYVRLQNKYLPANMPSAASLPEIINVTPFPSKTLDKGISSARITAEVIGAGTKYVFGIIIPPDFDPQKEFESWSDLEFPEFDFTPVPGEKNKYEYTYNGFTKPGAYTVIVNAENLDGSARPVETTIIVPDGIMKGDVNGDGKVSSVDAMLALQIAAGTRKPTAYEMQAADMNEDGKVTSSDAILILRYITGTKAPGSTLSSVPIHSQLLQNYPNPFNPETWIPYQLSEGSEVVIKIYSARGSLIKKLDLGYREAGPYCTRKSAAYWDGRDDFGNRVSSGVYFYQLEADNFRAVRKLVILE